MSYFFSVNQDSTVQQCNQIDSQTMNVISKGLITTLFAPLASIHTYAIVQRKREDRKCKLMRISLNSKVQVW